MKPLNFLELCGIDENTVFKRPDFNDEERMNRWLNDCIKIHRDMKSRGVKTMNLLDLVGLQPIHKSKEE